MVVENRVYQQPAFSSLLKQLVNNVNSLFFQHLELFRSEIKEDAEILAKYTVLAFIGALLAFNGLIFLGFFIMFTLSIALPLWASSLIVTVFYLFVALIAFVILKKQFDKVKKSPEDVIDETQKTMEEAKKWLHQLK